MIRTEGLFLNCEDPKHVHTEPEWRELKEKAVALAEQNEQTQLLDHLLEMYTYAKVQFGTVDPCTLTLLTNLALRHLAGARPKEALRHVLEALANINEFSEETKEEHITWLELGATCYRELEESRGKELLEKAIKILSTLTDANDLQMLSLEYRLQRYDEPFSCEEWHRRSTRYAHSEPRKAEEQIAKCTKIIQADSNDFNAFYCRGSAYLALTNEEKALADFEEVVRLAPDEAAGYHGRGLVFEYLGQFAKAIQEYGSALECRRTGSSFALDTLYPVRDSILFHKRGELHEKLGNLEDALVDISSAIEAEPFTSFFYRSRARLYEKLGQTEKASADHAQYLKLIKDSRTRTA